MEAFSCETKIIAGEGILPALAEFGAKRVFLVTDPFFMKNGWAGKVLKAAATEEYEIFDRVAPANF